MGAPLLQIEGLSVGYGDFQALWDISLSLNAAEVVAIIGANGAGKSTLLKSIAGLVRPRAGRIILEGRCIEACRPAEPVRLGVALVPEGRRLFPSLTVEENLLIGGQCGRKGPWSLARVLKLFPVLAERLQHRSTDLSGGQQQMVAIGRALMSNPLLLLCDEISLGLAPIIVKDIYKSIPAIAADGTAIVVVEQNIDQALAATKYAYCLSKGRIMLEGASAALSKDEIAVASFGGS